MTLDKMRLCMCVDVCGLLSQVKSFALLPLPQKDIKTASW